MRFSNGRSLVTWALGRFRDRVHVLLDPVGYHRSQGVRIGDDVDLIGASTHTFGSEPYLVTIGNGVTISSDVLCVTHDGGLRVIRHRHPGAFFYAPITIGERAFIGTQSMILPGVTIGQGAVVGARSLVASDVPADTVVAGVPARPIKSTKEYAFARRQDWIDTAGMSTVEKRRRILSVIDVERTAQRNLRRLART